MCMCDNFMAHHNIVYDNFGAQGVNQLWTYEVRLIQNLQALRICEFLIQTSIAFAFHTHHSYFQIVNLF